MRAAGFHATPSNADGASGASPMRGGSIMEEDDRFWPTRGTIGADGAPVGFPHSRTAFSIGEARESEENLGLLDHGMDHTGFQLSHEATMGGSGATWPPRELDCIEMIMLTHAAPPARPVPRAMAAEAGVAADSVLESTWPWRGAGGYDAPAATANRGSAPLAGSEVHVISDKLLIGGAAGLAGGDGNSFPQLPPAEPGGPYEAATAGLEALVECCGWPRELQPAAVRGGETEATPSWPTPPHDAAIVGSRALEADERARAAATAEKGRNVAATSAVAGDEITTGGTILLWDNGAPRADSMTHSPRPAHELSYSVAHVPVAETLSARRPLYLQHLSGSPPRSQPRTATLAPGNSAGAERGAGWDAIGQAIPQAAADAAADARWFDFPRRQTTIDDFPDNGVPIPRGGSRNIRARLAAADAYQNPRAAPASLPARFPLPDSHFLPPAPGSAAGPTSAGFAGVFSALAPAGSTSSNSSNSSCSSSSTSRQAARARRGMLSRSLVRTTTAPTAALAPPPNLDALMLPSSPDFPRILRDPVTGAGGGRPREVPGGSGEGGVAGVAPGEGARGGGKGELTAVREAGSGDDAMAPPVSHPAPLEALPSAQQQGQLSAPVMMHHPPPPAPCFPMMPPRGRALFSPPPAAAVAPAPRAAAPAHPQFFLPPPRIPRPSSAPAAGSLACSPRSPSVPAGSAAAAGTSSPVAHSQRLHLASHPLPRRNSAGSTSTGTPCPTNVLHISSSTSSSHSNQSNHGSYGSDQPSSHLRSLTSPLHASVAAAMAALPRPLLEPHPVPSLSSAPTIRPSAPLSGSSKPVTLPSPYSSTAAPASAAAATAQVSRQPGQQGQQGQQAGAALLSALSSPPLVPLPSFPPPPIALTSPATHAQQQFLRVGSGRRGRQQQQPWRPLPPEEFLSWDAMPLPRSHPSPALAAAAAPTTSAAAAAAYGAAAGASGGSFGSVPYLLSHGRHTGAGAGGGRQRLRTKSESDFTRPLLAPYTPLRAAYIAAGAGVGGFSLGSWEDSAMHADARTGATTTDMATADASLLAKRRRTSPQRASPTALPSSSQAQPTAPLQSMPQQHLPGQPPQHNQFLPCSSGFYHGQRSGEPGAGSRGAFHRSPSTPVFPTASIPSAAPSSPSLRPSAVAAAVAGIGVAVGSGAAGLAGGGGGGGVRDPQHGHLMGGAVGGLSMEMRKGAAALEDIVAQMQDEEHCSELSIQEQLEQMESEVSSKGGSTVPLLGLPQVQEAMAAVTSAGAPAAGAGMASSGAGREGTFHNFDRAGNIAE